MSFHHRRWAPLVGAALLVVSSSAAAAPEKKTSWTWTERRIFGLKVAGAGLLAGAVGGWALVSAHQIYVSAGSAASQREQARVGSRVGDRRALGTICLGLAGLGQLAGLTLVLWPASHQVTVAFSPQGFVVSGRM
jgi:hypothetical protein